MGPTVHVTTIDYVIIVAYLVLALVIGVLLGRRACKSLAEYFAAGRSLPWWLAGTSMVATTFAADTPLAVTGAVWLGISALQAVGGGTSLVNQLAE